MPPIPDVSSFVPPTTKANPAALDAEAEFLQASSTRIIGRGTEILGEMTSTAVEFSELVAAPLMREGGLSLDASRGAMQAAVYGSAITGQWAGHVREFNAEIERLTADWAAAVAAQFGKAGEPEPVIEAAGIAKLQEVNAAATAAHNLLLDRAKEAGSSLAGGPTPANLQALAAATGPSWMAYNLSGDPALIPMDSSGGEALARDLREALASGTVPAPLLQRMQTLQDIAARAQDLQARGSGNFLSAGELDFLEQFYKGMDQPLKPNLPIDTNALYHLPDILEHSGLSPAQHSMALGAVGGGLLALSDHRVGGGIRHLPDTVRGLIGRYFGVGGTAAKDPVNQLEALGDFLGATRSKDVGLDRLQGGEELSAGLTFAIADINANPALLNDGIGVDSQDLELSGVSDRARADILEAATRNIESNAQLLTGATVHPDYGSDTPEYLLRSLFGHKWEDGGEAAAGLVDWIPEQAVQDDPRMRQLATESAFQLITLATNDDAGGSWPTSTYDVLTDGFGSIDRFEAAPLGIANPRIAEAMGRTAIAYLPIFEYAETGAPDHLRPANDGSQEMYLSVPTREHFFELAMAHKDTSDLLGKAAYARMLGEVAVLTNDALDDHHAATTGANAAMLTNLLDKGYANIFTEARADADLATEQAAQHNSWFRAGAASLKEFVGGYVKAGRPLWDQLVRQLSEAPKSAPGVLQAHGWAWAGGDSPVEEARGSAIDPAQLRFHVSHALTEQLVREDPSEVRDLFKADDRLVVPDGSKYGYALKPAWDLRIADLPADLDNPKHEGSRMNMVKATEDLERLMCPPLHEKVLAYLQSFDLIRGR